MKRKTVLDKELQALENYILGKRGFLFPNSPPPSIDERIAHVFDNKINMTSADRRNMVFDLLLTNLAPQQQEELIGKLIMREWKSIKPNDDPNTFMRGASLPKTAMMYHFKKMIEENPAQIEAFLRDPIGYTETLKIPVYMQTILKEIVQSFVDRDIPLTELSHNIIFAMVSGPVTDYYNAKIADVNNKINLAKEKGNTGEVDRLTKELRVYDDLFKQVMSKGRVLTDSNKMLTQHDFNEKKAAGLTQDEIEVKKEGIRTRKEEVAKQVIKLGISSKELNGYAKSQDLLMTSLNENYQQGSIIRDTETNRALFQEVANKQQQEKGNQSPRELPTSEPTTPEPLKQSNVNQSQTDNVQSVTEISSPQTPRKGKPDRTLRGAMKVSSENLTSTLTPEEIKEARIKLASKTTTQSQKLEEPTTEPTASTSGSETRPRSPKGIGTHRPPLPNFNPAPASSPDSPREKVTTGTQRTTSDSEKTPPPSPRDIKIATHRPPPPDYSAPSPPASPRGQPMIGMQRKQSTENLAAKSGTTSDPENTATSRPRRGAIIDRQSDNSKEASPSSPRKEPASDNIQLASSLDIERLRKQVAEVKAKAKALETRVAETRQDYKNVKDQRLEVNKLDTEIGGLEAKKEAAKILREEHQAKIAQHREKTSTQQLTGSHPQEKDSLPPQVKDMMTKSIVQQKKAEKIADAADAAKTNPRHSTPSRGSERR